MVAIAGQPEYVGVIVTTTRPSLLDTDAEHAEVVQGEHRHLRVGDRAATARPGLVELVERR